MILTGVSLLLLGGFALAANGDGQKSSTVQGKGYGFVDANGDGINDRFVDANGDGIDDNWVDADGDGINDLIGTSAGSGYGRVSPRQAFAGNGTTKVTPFQATGKGFQRGMGRGR